MLERIYQYLEDNYALEGEEGKMLISSFIESSGAWLDNYRLKGIRSRDELLVVAANLKESAAGIGFLDFEFLAENLEKSLNEDNFENIEENYRLLVIQLNRLKNEFGA